MPIPKRIIIHHTADPDQAHQLKKVDEWHKFLGFPKSSLGYYVGYTYLIETDGIVVKTRQDDEVQAHTKGMNEGSIGICLAGDFNRHDPTTNQRHSLRLLLNEKIREYRLLRDDIGTHRLFRDTTCPGKRISDSEIRVMFEPDLPYFQDLINRISEIIRNLSLKLKLGVFGKANEEDGF